MSNELGATRKQLEEQARRQAETEKFINEQANPATDWDAEIAAIKEAMEEGTIGSGDGAERIATLAAERSEARALERADAMYQEREARSWRQQQNEKYIELEPDFPDFAERFQNNEFDDIKKMHPYLGGDPVLAHQRWKRIQAEDQLKAAKAEGKQAGVKEAQKLLNGTDKTQKVLPGAGNAASQIKPPPPTLEDAKARFVNQWKETGGDFK